MVKSAFGGPITIYEMHISEFQQLISQKYKTRDQQRGIPATFMWFVEELGELATALASDNEKDKQEEFADVFAWLCTLANISNVDLEKACAKYTRKTKKGFKPK
jgi:NTP pyrophosphatase (non-canonical NTP hydrolase)